MPIKSPSEYTPPLSSSPDADVVVKAGRAIWIVAALMMIATWMSYRFAALSCNIWSQSNALLAVAVCIAVAHCYRRWRPDPFISIGAEGCAQLSVILTLGTLLNYPLAAAAFPYRDADLHAIDLSLGLDWRTYLHFFNTHPTLGAIIDAAYHSIRVQFLLVLGVLVATSRFVRLQQFILAITFSLLVALVIFAFVPATGAYIFLQIPSADYANLSPSSFHTVCAILFAWALLPVRILRWPIVALNVLMISSTPISGAHYFIDLVAGSIVAALSIACAALFTRMLRLGSLSGILSPGRADIRSSPSPSV